MKQIVTPLFKRVNTIVSSNVNKDNPACTSRKNSCLHLSFLLLRIEISFPYVSEQLHVLQGESSLLIARNIQSHALGCLFLEFSCSDCKKCLHASSFPLVFNKISLSILVPRIHVPS
jgi:hypothetical protein